MSCSPFSIHSLSPSSQVDHLSANSGDISNASSPSLSAPVLKTPGSVSVGKNFSVTPENSGCPSSVCSQCPCAQHIRDLYRDMDRVVEILVQARKEHIEDLLPKFSKEGMEKLAADHKVSAFVFLVILIITPSWDYFSAHLNLAPAATKLIIEENSYGSRQSKGLIFLAKDKICLITNIS